MKCHDDSETSFVFIVDKSSTSEIEPTVDDIDETVKSLPSDHLGLPQMKKLLNSYQNPFQTRKPNSIPNLATQNNIFLNHRDSTESSELLSKIAKSTQNPKRQSPSSVKQQRNAFVTGKIRGWSTDFLLTIGACISILDARFVKNVLSYESLSIMVPSIYSEVDTISNRRHRCLAVDDRRSEPSV